MSNCNRVTGFIGLQLCPSMLFSFFCAAVVGRVGGEGEMRMQRMCCHGMCLHNLEHEQPYLCHVLS